MEPCVILSPVERPATFCEVKISTLLLTKVVFHFTVWLPFLNGTHDISNWFWPEWPCHGSESFSSRFPLLSAKAREFGELWREKYARATWTFYLNWAELVLFGQPDWKIGSNDLSLHFTK